MQLSNLFPSPITRTGINRRKFIQYGSLALGAGIFTACSGETVAPSSPASLASSPTLQQELSIAFAHIGPISDNGWTYTHHLGRKAVEQSFPKLKNIVEVENVPYTPEATRTFQQFVDEGVNMVFISGEYGDLLYPVSDKHPDVVFYECNGHRTADNLNWFYVEHWLPTYLIGVAAGRLTKTNKLGYVGSFPVPAVFASVNAFHLGARSVNPGVTTQIININSWFDPQAANKAGNALIDSGADFLMGIMDEPAYLQVAEKRGVWAAVWSTDIRRHGPNAYVSSVLLDWRDYYVAEVQKRLEGNWIGKRGELLPMGKGVNIDKWGQKVPQEIQQEINDIQEKVKQGFNPFVGPLKDDRGQERVKQGETLDKSNLYQSMDWSLEGVSGIV